MRMEILRNRTDWEETASLNADKSSADAAIPLFADMLDHREIARRPDGAFCQAPEARECVGRE